MNHIRAGISAGQGCTGVRPCGDSDYGRKDEEETSEWDLLIALPERYKDWNSASKL